MVNTDITREVRATLQRWLDGTVAADADTLEHLVASDYTFTHASNGHADTREEWLESFRNGSRRYHVWTITDESYRVYPGVVLVQGVGHQEMGPVDNRRNLETTFLCVWVNDAGAWRCASWQATEIRSR